MIKFWHGKKRFSSQNEMKFHQKKMFEVNQREPESEQMKVNLASLTLGLWLEREELWIWVELLKSHNKFPHGANTNRFMINRESFNSSAMIDGKASN